MKRKVLITLIFFAVLYVGEIAFSFSFKSDDKNNFNSSEYFPISQSLDNFYSSNYQTIVIDNYISELMAKWDINGASVAISKEGRLVYAKGFGYADKDNEITLKPKHLFRIASVSKLVTAVAIMKLYEEEQLSLEDKVFGPEGILNDTSYHAVIDPMVFDITIDQLLRHTAGWKNERGDPVFAPKKVAETMKSGYPVDANMAIKYMLQQRKLDFTPGMRYSYSNFGYVVLGKVIEKITGMGYENYVKFAILTPLGIHDMRIGGSFYNELDSNEVRYYLSGGDEMFYSYDGTAKIKGPYGNTDLSLLGAAGGWIASAAELMKLIVAIDGFDTKADILNPETIALMTTPDKNGRSLIGWRDTDGHGTWWRTGTLMGTRALVMRQFNNINWIVLLNTSPKGESRLHNSISRTMFEALGNMNQWPDYDLFNYHQVRDSYLARSGR